MHTMALESVRVAASRFSGRSLEIYSAWTMMLWAAILALPGETFTRPWYAHMREIADETTWSLALFLAGASQAYAVAACRSHGVYWCRITAATISCMTWFYIALPLLWRSPPAAGAAPYFSLACAMLLVIGRGRPT